MTIPGIEPAFQPGSMPGIVIQCDGSSCRPTRSLKWIHYL